MKKILIIFALFMLGQNGYSNPSGLLFNVSLSGMTLSFSPKANHSYTEVGMLITNQNYSFSSPNTQCSGWPNTNDYCLFSASPSSPASISVNGPIGTLRFKLCLNYWGQLSCQNYAIDITEQSRCTGAGGKIVLGSDNCWIKQAIPVSTTILRCSTVCSDVGLVLQQPGPTNDSTLAGNVCAAYGYTDSPTQRSPGTITFIGQVDFLGSTSCVWDNLTGVNWDNPNNTDYDGQTGNYICPCI